MVATPTSRAAGSRNCSQLKARIVPRKLFGRGTLVAPVPPGVVPGVHSESKEATNAVVLDGMLTAREKELPPPVARTFSETAVVRGLKMMRRLERDCRPLVVWKSTALKKGGSNPVQIFEVWATPE